MLDWIFATISMAGLLAFMGTVVIFVREPDLIIVTVAVLVIGIFYFVQELRAGGTHLETENKSDKPGE